MSSDCILASLLVGSFICTNCFRAIVKSVLRLLEPSSLETIKKRWPNKCYLTRTESTNVAKNGGWQNLAVGTIRVYFPD